MAQHGAGWVNWRCSGGRSVHRDRHRAEIVPRRTPQLCENRPLRTLAVSRAAWAKNPPNLRSRTEERLCYEEAARRMGLDRRTVKAKVELYLKEEDPARV